VERGVVTVAPPIREVLLRSEMELVAVISHSSAAGQVSANTLVSRRSK